MYRIMIAEENRKEYHRMKEMIAHLPEEILVLPCAFDTESFINILSTQEPDLVIADIQLPGLEGFRTVEYIRYIKCPAQIVLLSSCTEFEEVQLALRQGAADYLKKPVYEEELLDCIQRLIQKWTERGAGSGTHGAGKYSYHKYMRLAEKEFMMSLLLENPDAAVLEELSDDGEMKYYIMTVEIYDRTLLTESQLDQIASQVFADEICLKLYFHAILYLLICRSQTSVYAGKEDDASAWIDAKVRETAAFFEAGHRSVRIGVSDGMKSSSEFSFGLKYALNTAREAYKTEDSQILAEAGRYSAREKSYADQALDYMSQNFGGKMSLSEVASSIGVTGFYLSHIMSRVKNKTFSELLTDIRVAKATELLQEGQKTAKEISDLCGYSNVKYFYRVMKQHTGMTVKEIQNAGRKITRS